MVRRLALWPMFHSIIVSTFDDYVGIIKVKVIKLGQLPLAEGASAPADRTALLTCVFRALLALLKTV